MTIQRILITGRIYRELEEILRNENLRQELRFVAEEEVAVDDFIWADAYVAFRPTANFQFGNMKWVHALGAGVDSFLYERAWKRDVKLTRTTGPFGRKISEYCLSYMLQELQQHHIYKEQQYSKAWHVIEPKSLSSQTAVIYGTGAIGQEIARTLGMLGVICKGVSLSGREVPYFQKTVQIGHAEAVIADADWIISTLPLTKETEGVFDASFFEQLHGTGFINVGRGATVEEGALLQALQNGNVRLAILDVFNEEPLSSTSLLWDAPNITITPHISAITSVEEAAASFLETLACLETGQELNNEVNVEKGY